MTLSAPIIALGATLGTASGLLALCGLVFLCRCVQDGKGAAEQEEDKDMAAEQAKPSMLRPAQQFHVKKTAEPVQPRPLLSPTRIYGPKPALTSPEMINYADYTLSTTLEEPASSSSAGPGPAGTAGGGSKEIFVIPQNGCAEELAVCETLNPEPPAEQNRGPRLHFSLWYESRRSELRVTLIEAVNVSPTESPNQESCDCYVLGNLMSKPGSAVVEAQTSLRRRTSHPVWDETLVFPVSGGGISCHGTLQLSLRGCSKFSRYNVLGEALIDLPKMGTLSGEDYWADLKVLDKDPAACLGEILLSVSYLPAANRLIVVVMKARKLRSDTLKDVIGRDLSVKLTLRHQSSKLKKKQTKRVKHKMNPVWNEMVMFEVPQELLNRSSVELEMLNQEATGRNRLVGRCSLGLQSGGPQPNHWQEMLKNPRKQIAMWHELHI
ncbi:synaptotagmin-13 [Latimeria chalumnae]|uniref:synaptotagmin-13 n=1 Tax=Latimeria chalumnae TaxID=7897 RepID=UPI0003C1356D|nr:PREDICTED: synaptotagmin-13 [Latimeria chalumnae]|eukprot:XP_005987027.1 PREDICTED: synaptotagmin-13 [Latimeria chalumnae]